MKDSGFVCMYVHVCVCMHIFGLALCRNTGTSEAHRNDRGRSTVLNENQI